MIRDDASIGADTCLPEALAAFRQEMLCVNQHDLPDDNVIRHEAVQGNSRAYSISRPGPAGAFTLLLGRRYNRQKNTHGGDRKSSDQSEHLKNSAKKIADEHGVDAKTVKRAGKFAEAADVHLAQQWCTEFRVPQSPVASLYTYGLFWPCSCLTCTSTSVRFRKGT